MRIFRMLLILSHRYIGIPLSFMFVVWFLSAYFMIYAGGMPRLTPAMQAQAAAPLDLALVKLTPAEIQQQSGYPPVSASLRTLFDRPLYELVTPGFPTERYFADDGTVRGTLSQTESVQLAADFLQAPPAQLRLIGTLNTVDQWTISNARELPLYHFALADEHGTEIYVSPGQASVAVVTTTKSRLLAWLGTIPHWLYFEALRVDQGLWYQLVVYSAGLGTVLAILGLALGVTQFRKVRPFQLSKAIPYQGTMRWHYISGVVFGLVSLTWVFSGLLSMEPFAWTNASGVSVDPAVFEQGELDLARFGTLDDPELARLMPQGLKQLELVWRQGLPYLLATYVPPAMTGADQAADDKRDRLHQAYNIAGQSEAASMLVNPVTKQQVSGFANTMLTQQLDAAVSEAAVIESTLLNNYDDYYYSRGGELPLPVLRVKFDDPMQSWIYVDSARAELLSLVHKWSRVERWLYNGLHSLDFAFWYHQRPLWDIGVLLLLTGGTVSSLLGFYFGMRRLVQDLKRALAFITSRKIFRRQTQIS